MGRWHFRAVGWCFLAAALLFVRIPWQQRLEGDESASGRQAVSYHGKVPAELVQIPSSTRSALLVDLSAYRLFLFENRQGGLVRKGDFPISIGKRGIGKQVEGDEKTPIGLYFVQSYIPDEQLPDLYGAGAFPVDYPNAWDRRLGRTGSGIWIHGTEYGTTLRAPRSSRGCITLPNGSFELIRPFIEAGTPVVVSEQVQWSTGEQVEAERRSLAESVESWRAAWESLETARYLTFYDTSFRYKAMDWKAWAAHKRRVNSQKTFIKVSLDDLGIFRYPGEEDLWVVEFRQTYRSDDFNRETRKRQYWKRFADGWRIVQESQA